MHSDTQTVARTVIMELIGSFRGYANGRKYIKMIQISVLKCLRRIHKTEPSFVIIYETLYPVEIENLCKHTERNILYIVRCEIPF
jgi:hypothetical protein